MITFEKETSINAILYILERLGGTCDIHKLSKILYFADRKHLSDYGRLITGDYYIKMPFGPVPNKIYDIIKILRGESLYSDHAPEFTPYFSMRNKETLQANSKTNMDYLSESDVECLDMSIEMCKDKSFGELTNMSHQFAWENAKVGRFMSYYDILSEIEDNDEEYIKFVVENIERDIVFA